MMTQIAPPHMLTGPTNVMLNTVRYFRDPYGTLVRTLEHHGEPFTWPFLSTRMVVTSDPAGVRTLFTADPDAFSALAADLLGPVIGATNLILLSGERHRAMRKLQAPCFHGARMRAYGQLIHDVTQEQLSSWPADRPFCMHRSAQAISLEVILQAVLGLGDLETRQAFKDAVLGLMGALKPSFMFFPALRRELLGLSPWSRFLGARRRVQDLFDQELARRRADQRPRQDILSLFMEARYDDGSKLDDQDLMIQMMNLVVAGHETTASSLAWACALVHRHPAVHERLRAELRSAGGSFDAEVIAALPYLDAVCSETLRLNPVAPLFGRELTRPLTVQGHELQAGALVGIAALLVHRRADLYPEPERFQPERFLERSFTPFEYLPFGGGARRCLGAAFALYEMKIALAAVVRDHPLRLLDSGPLRPAVRNTTVGPRGGIRMIRAA